MPLPNETDVFQDWRNIADKMVNAFQEIIDAEEIDDDKLNGTLENAVEVLRIAREMRPPAEPPPNEKNPPDDPATRLARIQDWSFQSGQAYKEIKWLRDFLRDKDGDEFADALPPTPYRLTAHAYPLYS